jgi:hypothetical protein
LCALVVGNRHHTCLERAERIVSRLLAPSGPSILLIHGGGPGVRNSFASASRDLGISTEPHLADWKGLGSIASPVRNKEMVDSGANLCIAIHRSIARSMSAKTCILHALKAGIPIYLIEDERAIPRRLEFKDTPLATTLP